MIPYFSPIVRQEELMAAGQRWHGTPFCENSRAPGKGVSCHMLVACLLEETGAIERRTDWLMGSCKTSPTWRLKQLESWTDANLVPPLASSVWAPDAGDVVTITFGHIGILSRDGTRLVLIHCLRQGGVRIDNWDDVTWSSRASRVWRPMES